MLRIILWTFLTVCCFVVGSTQFTVSEVWYWLAILSGALGFINVTFMVKESVVNFTGKP